MNARRLTAAAIAVAAAATIAPATAEAATRYFSTTKTVSGTGTVSCPAGYRATGGGASLPADRVTPKGQAPKADDLRYALRSTRPNSKSTGWQASATVTRTVRVGKNGTGISADGYMVGTVIEKSYKPRVYAICIR